MEEPTFIKLFNPNLRSEYSNELQQRFITGFDRQKEEIKDALHASFVIAWTYGSIQVGTSQPAIGKDPGSDTDVYIMYFPYAGKLPVKPFDNNPAFKKCVDQLSTDIPGFSLGAVFSANEVLTQLRFLNTLQSKVTEEQLKKSILSDFPNPLLTNMLMTFLIGQEFAGDKEYIIEMKKLFIEKIRDMGNAGAIVWEEIQTLFQERYINYGKQHKRLESNAATERRTKRLLRTVNELRARRKYMSRPTEHTDIQNPSANEAMIRRFTNRVLFSLHLKDDDFKESRKVVERLKPYRNRVTFPSLEDADALLEEYSDIEKSNGKLRIPYQHEVL